MKVVVIEEKVFEDLLSSIEMFVHKFEQTLNSESEKAFRKMAGYSRSVCLTKSIQAYSTEFKGEWEVAFYANMQEELL